MFMVLFVSVLSVLFFLFLLFILMAELNWSRSLMSTHDISFRRNNSFFRRLSLDQLDRFCLLFDRLGYDWFGFDWLNFNWFRCCRLNISCFLNFFVFLRRFSGD